jgi:hypothetical protein
MPHPEKLEVLKSEIGNGLIQIQEYINFKKRTNQEISFISELFLEELLNETYRGEGFQFKNMNHEIPNYPAIDIADEEKGISYQITITNDSSDLKVKINHTLEMFFKHKFHKKYKKLYIVVVSGITARKKLPLKTKFNDDGKRITIDPDLFSSGNIIDLTALANQEIFKRPAKFESVLKVIQKIPNRPEKNIIPFNFKKTYIKRTVNDVKNNQKIQLDDAIKKNRLNVLLGVGGLGKTTEVNWLAHKISQEENYFCFKTRLINYANSLERHINAYCKYWQNVPNGYETLIILDGLDEVNSLQFDTVFKEIKEFALLNEKIKILVTCRTNFNPFYVDEKDSNEVDEFVELFLDELKETDIKNFIREECNSPEVFLHGAEKSNITEIFKNPFYLANAVEIFNSQNLVPENKSDFYIKLIEQRIEKEKKKNFSFRQKINEYYLKEGLKLLALTMQLSGEYQISNYDFNQIIKTLETSDAIKRIFFHQTDEYWQFEHNNFQEFLAAEAVSKLDWNKIKKIILLPNGKLKPKWLNAFSFLVNVVPEKNELISWFVKNDTESLIKVEPNKIEPDIRDQIFIDIFEKHKKEETVIWRVAYSTKNMYHFVQLESNDTIIQFLIEQIKSNQANIQSISNAVHILEELDYPTKFEKEIQETYFKLLTNKRNHKYGISYSIFTSFTKWKMFNIELKNRLIQIDSLFIQDSPFSSLCRFLSTGSFSDISADLVYKIIQAMEKNRVIGSEYGLFKLIKFMTVNELISLIKKLTPNDFQNSSRIWIKDLFKQINIHAIKLYTPDSEIEKTISEFIYSSVVYHDESYAKEFKSFYEKTNIVFQTFKSYFLSDLKSEKSKRREYFTVPALLANENCLDWVVRYYLSNNFSNDMMWNFLIALSHIGNHDGRNYFMKRVKEPTNGRFEPKPNPYEEFNKKKEDLFLKAILNKKSTLKYLKLGFNLFDNEIIDRSEINNKLFDKEDRYQDVEQSVGLEIISRHSGETINRQKFLKYYSSNKNWEKLAIDEYHHRIAYQKFPIENIDWLRNWCYKKLPEITFKGALQKKEDGGFSVSKMTYLFLEFVLFLDLPLEEKVILEVTTLLGAFDFDMNYENGKSESRLYSYLKKHCSQKTIQNQLLQNLNGKELIDSVLDCHAKILKNENIIEALPLLPKFIINSKIPKHIRNEIFDFYVQNSGSIDRILPILETLTLNGKDDYFDWNVINMLIKNKRPEVVQLLTDAINNKEKDQLKIGIHLLKAGQPSAFKVISENLRMIKDHSENEVLTSAISSISLKQFRSIELFKFFSETLEIYIIQDLGKSGFNNILPTIFNKLFELIIEANVDENLVLDSIEEILDSNKPNETSRRARYEFYELRNKINIHNDKGCQISDAIKELKELGIEYEF